MNLSSDLLTDFAKTVNGGKKTNNEVTVLGVVTTIVDVDGDGDEKVYYVKLDGSEVETPVSTTADVKAGERVTVLVKDHSAFISGNLKSPAARVADVKATQDNVDNLSLNAMTSNEANRSFIKLDFSNLADGSIPPDKIKDASITSAKLVKVDDLAKLGDSLDGSIIKDESITPDKIKIDHLSQFGAMLNGSFIVPGSIASDRLADGSVTREKLADFGDRVLWAGTWNCDSYESVTLMEYVSDQMNGVVLVFSEYDGNEALDSSFHTYFIPKYTVYAHTGVDYVIPLLSGDLSYSAVKRLTVYDDEIYGDGINVETTTSSSGMTYTNGRFALRYVIGV